MVFAPETIAINGDPVWNTPLLTDTGDGLIGANAVDWASHGITCTGLGVPVKPGVPQCTNISWAMQNTMYDLEYIYLLSIGGSTLGGNTIVTEPSLTVRPMAGLRYWMDGDNVGAATPYRYANLYDPLIGAPVPTTPETIYLTDAGSGFSDNPGGKAYDCKCNVGEVMVGIKYFTQTYPGGVNKVPTTYPKGLQAVCVPANNIESGKETARGALPANMPTGQGAFSGVTRCGQGRFPYSMFWTAIPDGTANVGTMGCTSQAQAQAYKDYAEHFPVLSSDPVCTAGTTDTSDPAFVSAEAACLKRAQRICGDASITFTDKDTYCACIDAKQLDPSVPVRCVSIGDCTKIVNTARGESTPGTWTTYEYADRKNCPPITLTDCSFLQGMSAQNMRLLGDTVVFNCGQKTCPECGKNGGGTCRSLKKPYVCQPPGSDGTCADGFVSCETTTTVSHPTAGKQPWYFLFIDPAPFYVGGTRIGSTGTVSIVGVVIAFVLFVLILFGVITGSIRLHRYLKKS